MFAAILDDVEEPFTSPATTGCPDDPSFKLLTVCDGGEKAAADADELSLVVSNSLQEPQILSSLWFENTYTTNDKSKCIISALRNAMATLTP